MDKPVILHLETATEVCSVGLSRGAHFLNLKETSEPFQHASQINSLIQACLDDAALSFQDLDAVSVSEGPGSYTALRVGASTAKGLVYSLGIPLIAVPTLYALAHQMRQLVTEEECFLVPMLDARRQDAYLARYDHALNELDKAAMLTISDNLFAEWTDRKVCIGGSAAGKAVELLSCDVHKVDFRHSAKILLEPALESWKKESFVSPAYFSPNYITSPNITTPKKAL